MNTVFRGCQVSDLTRMPCTRRRNQVSSRAIRLMRRRRGDLGVSQPPAFVRHSGGSRNLGEAGAFDVRPWVGVTVLGKRVKLILSALTEVT